MLAKVTEGLVRLFSKPGKKNTYLPLALFALIVAPVVFIAVFSYISTRRDLTELALSRREALARLASITLQEKFDRIVDVGISFSTRVQFRKLIEAGKW